MAQINLSKRVHFQKLHRLGLRWAVLVLLLLGIFCRFANLGEKVYWGDETYSSARIAGFGETEIVQRIYTGQPLSVADLAKYQQPNAEKSLADAVTIMATEAPHHPALYYILARGWEQTFGSAIAVKRTLPVLIGLLALPALYWLCWELFGSALVGWMSVALFAVSPIQVLYAQEVRGYSFWVLATLLSSAALLRALRVKTVASWGLYPVTLALCFYSHLFGLLGGLVQFIYVLAIERGWTRNLRSYLLSLLGAIALFSPWILVFFGHERQASEGWGWVIVPTPPDQFYLSWAKNLLYGFFDLSGGIGDPFQLQSGLYTLLLAMAVLVLVGYAAYFLWRTTPLRVWLFVLLLMLSTTLPLVLPDLVSGGLRSTIPRYQLPSYVGILLAVAYLLATKLDPFLAKIRPQTLGQQRLWQGVTAIVLTAGAVSCVSIAQSHTWWTKYSDYYNAEVAQVINQSAAPLVLSDSDYNRILALSHELKPNVKFQLVARTKGATQIPEAQLPVIQRQYSDVLLLETNPPRPLLRAALKQKGYRFKLLYGKSITFKGRQVALFHVTPP